MNRDSQDNETFQRRSWVCFGLGLAFLILGHLFLALAGRLPTDVA